MVAADLSSVDVLTMAVSAAGMLRSSGNPEVALANAYAALGLEPPQGSDPLPIRIVRLILDAGADRQRLYDYLRRIEGPLSWDRPPTPPDQQVELAREDEEARRYVHLLEKDQLGPGHSMFWRSDAYPYFPSFRLLERSSVLWFDGPTVVLRDGRELPAQEAVPPQTGDEWTCKPLELPNKVKGLIDYPFEVATLFEIEAGGALGTFGKSAAPLLIGICSCMSARNGTAFGETICRPCGSRIWYTIPNIA